MYQKLKQAESSRQIYYKGPFYDLAINVFGYTQKEGIFPLYMPKNNLQVEPVNLLLSSDENKSHFSWIKDFLRMLYDTRHNGKKYF